MEYLLNVKLLIQIPCLNEEENIAEVLDSIPRQIEGISEVKVLVIDDASTDQTVKISDAHGAEFIITKSRTKGLSDSFQLGQEFFLAKGFDILVNTDGDNQYHQNKIIELVAPIIAGKAEMVIGNRGTWDLAHFSLPKRILQTIGSKILSSVAKTQVLDAASGFRSYSRVAISQIFITSRFSYAMESLIQVGNKRLPIANVLTGAKPVQRPSRLFKSSFEHVKHSAGAILRGFLNYQPLMIFSWLALFLFVGGSIPMVRYLILVSSGVAGDHLQSLLLGSLLISTAATFLVLGLLAQLSKVNREVAEHQITLARLSQTDGDFERVLELHGARIFTGERA